jgi:hypothetical protein
LQQTPSAQKPEAQSAFLTQTAARDLRPQLPFTHLTPLAQSASWLHAVKHLLVDESQLKGAHTVVGPGLQRPPESQTKTPSTAAPSHAPAWQTDPGAYLRHAPAPLHRPSNPQVATSVFAHMLATRGAAPFGTNEHVPGASAVLHDLHVSLQAVLQHTPSAQNPLTQSPSHPQACPLAFFIPPVPLQATPASVPDELFPQPLTTIATIAPTSSDRLKG